MLRSVHSNLLLSGRVCDSCPLYLPVSVDLLLDSEIQIVDLIRFNTISLLLPFRWSRVVSRLGRSVVYNPRHPQSDAPHETRSITRSENLGSTTSSFVDLTTTSYTSSFSLHRIVLHREFENG